MIRRERLFRLPASEAKARITTFKCGHPARLGAECLSPKYEPQAPAPLDYASSASVKRAHPDLEIILMLAFAGWIVVADTNSANVDGVHVSDRAAYQRSPSC